LNRQQRIIDEREATHFNIRKEKDMKRKLTADIKNQVIDNTPGGIIKFFACPYVAGYSLKSAVDRARELLNEDILTTVDVLGESAVCSESAEGFRDLYLRTITALADNFPDKVNAPSISLKPSSMVCAIEGKGQLKIDRNVCESHIEEIVKAAQRHQINVTIDMEDHNWTDVTLAIYKNLRNKGYDNVGTVLQSMLFRTENDIDHLPEKPRIRICTGGIYTEPSAIALQTKPEMKEALVKIAGKLFEKDAYVEIATHDEKVIRNIFEEYIIPNDISTEKFEIQMLLGVPKDKIQTELISGKYLGWGKGVKVRLYVPFAEDEADAIKYCKRRLAANPDLIKYGLKTFLRS
jgi:proline dehydrogenase